MKLRSGGWVALGFVIGLAAPVCAQSLSIHTLTNDLRSFNAIRVGATDVARSGRLPDYVFPCNFGCEPAHITFRVATTRDGERAIAAFGASDSPSSCIYGYHTSASARHQEMIQFHPGMVVQFSCEVQVTGALPVTLIVTSTGEGQNEYDLTTPGIAAQSDALSSEGDRTLRTRTWHFEPDCWNPVRATIQTKQTGFFGDFSVTIRGGTNGLFIRNLSIVSTDL